jgi:hypothetical protein
MGLSQWQCVQMCRLRALALSEGALTFGIRGLEMYQKPSLVLNLAIKTQELVSFCSNRSQKKQCVQGQAAATIRLR